MRLHSFYVQFKNDLCADRLKLMLLSFLFFFQIIMSIIGTFYMQDLLKLFGIELLNPITPSGEVALADFFSDVFLFGIIIASLGTMNIFAGDIESGSINYSLSRPITREDYSIAKIFSRLITLIVPFIIASFFGWFYLLFFFTEIPLINLVWTLIPIALFYSYIGVVTSLLSTRFTSLTAGFSAIAIFIVQFAIAAFKPLELLSPFTFAAFWPKLLNNNLSLYSWEAIRNLGMISIWILIPLILVILSMRRKDF
ncbi:ABC transporter permease subunit [Candidatus Hodarchaeum mangrovi]